MKTKITFLTIALVAFFATSSFADETSNAHGAASKTIANYLQNNLKYPTLHFGEKPACCVWVEVEVQNDGSFKVVCSNSENNEMRMAVTNEIEHLQKDKNRFAQYAGERAYVKIKFKLK